MKTILKIIVLAAIISSGCTAAKKESSKCCNIKQSNSTKMDTITVVISGRTFNCGNNRILGQATIKLDGDYGTYETIAGNDGKFAFYHIPSGTYYLDVTKEGYCKIKHKEVKFDSGNVIDMVAYLTKQ